MLAENALNKVNFKADIIFTDIPYGNLASWENFNEFNEDAVNLLISNLIPVLKPTSVIAGCSNKLQKIRPDRFRRLEKQQIGKRKFEILKLNQ